MRGLALLAIIFALAAGLAFGGTRVASAQDQPVIHIALSPFEAQANVYYALDLGLFKRAGLNVDIQQYQGGEAIVAGIIAGAVQIGAGNPLPLANAFEHGFDVVLVAPGTITDAAQPQSGLVVPVNSPFKVAKDLNGKLIAVNTLNSIDQIGAQQWVDRNGGDSKTLRFIEMPGALMVDAVTSGRVDVVSIANPPYTAGLESGRVRLLAYGYDAIAKRFMITAWFATRTWANANPETIRKFSAALNEASTWAVKNPAAAAAVLRKYLKTTTSIAHERHARSLDPVLIQPLIDAAVNYNRLAKPLDVRNMIWH